MPTPHHPSLAARRVLQKLGADIRDARRRRGLPAGILADRAFTTRPTLQKVEAGNPAVSIGIYAAVLNALGLLEGVGKIADVANDPVGLTLAKEKVPTRIHLRSRRKPSDGR